MTHLHLSARTASLLLLGVLLGCAPSRTIGPGRPIGYYDYCVLTPRTTYRYHDTAAQMLNQSFVVLHEDDPRLDVPSVRQKACMLTLDWSPGFWSSSAEAEVKDYGNGTHVLTSHMRRGMFWAGAHADVIDAIRDVASARAAGPALPPEARDPALAPAAESVQPPGGTRSKSARLTELQELRTKRLITEAEYSIQRQKVIDAP